MAEVSAAAVYVARLSLAVAVILIVLSGC